MSARHGSAVLLAVLGALTGGAGSGCGDPDVIVDPEPPSAPPRAMVIYDVSGGIALSAHKLVVDEEGERAEVSFFEGDRLRSREIALSEAEEEEVREALSGARFLEAPEPTGVCADCFTYSVRAYGIDLEADSGMLGAEDLPPETADLIEVLGGIVGRYAPPSPAGPDSPVSSGQGILSPWPSSYSIPAMRNGWRTHSLRTRRWRFECGPGLSASSSARSTCSATAPA